MANPKVPKTDYDIKVSLEGAFLRACRNPMIALFGIRLWVKLGYHLPEEKRLKVKTMLNPETGNGGFSGQTRKEWMYELGMKGREQKMTRLATAARKCGMVISEERHIKRTLRTLALHKLHPDFVEKIRRITNEKPKIFHSLTESAHVQKALGDGTPPVQKALGKEGTLTESAQPKDSNTNTLKESKALISTPSSYASQKKIGKPSRKTPGGDENLEEENMNRFKNEKKLALRAKGDKSFEEVQKEKRVPEKKKKKLDLSRVGGYEKYWTRLRAKSFPGKYDVAWTGREQGYAKSIIPKLIAAGGLDLLKKFTCVLIKQWASASGYVGRITKAKAIQRTPSIAFVSRHLPIFLEWFQEFGDTPEKAEQKKDQKGRGMEAFRNG